MGKLIRDFRCHTCGKHTERFIDTEANEIQCDCGGVATRIIGMPHVTLDGTNPDFPGAYEKWARVREQNRSVMAKKSWREE